MKLEICAKTKKKLARSKKIKKLQNEGKLTVLAIAVETNKKNWETNCSNLPTEWVNAYCEDCEAITKSYIKLGDIMIITKLLVIMVIP